MDELNNLLLLQFDHAWEHPWESLQSALKEVTEELFAWQPACYRDEPPEANWPPAGTIHWHLAHLDGCKRYYTAMIRSRPGEPKEGEFLPSASLKAQLESLTAAHRDLRATIAALKAEDLSVRVGNRQTVAEFVIMNARHDIWHASQIKLVQRLWKTRPAAL